MPSSGRRPSLSGVIALLLALALSGPPKASLNSVPLAVSSWCWGSRCGAPIAASRRTVVTTKGAAVHVTLGFEPTQVHVAVAGAPVKAVNSLNRLSWRATRGGGVTITATGTHGWVTYVGRLRLR
jgi:hypothetical protein